MTASYKISSYINKESSEICFATQKYIFDTTSNPSGHCGLTMHLFTLALSLGGLATALCQTCPDYASYSTEHHGPYSSGRYNLSYQRPSTNCRTFVSQGVEDTINRLRSTIKDPDLFRLFENSFP